MNRQARLLGKCALLHTIERLFSASTVYGASDRWHERVERDMGRLAITMDRRQAAAAALGTSRYVSAERTNYCQRLYAPQSADTQLIIQINRSSLFICWHVVEAAENDSEIQGFT